LAFSRSSKIKIKTTYTDPKGSNGDFKMITLILAILIGCGADKEDSANKTDTSAHSADTSDTAE
jgi:hypothetical protein